MAFTYQVDFLYNLALCKGVVHKNGDTKKKRPESNGINKEVELRSTESSSLLKSFKLNIKIVEKNQEIYQFEF